MSRQYKAIIRLYKIVVIRQGTCDSITSECKTTIIKRSGMRRSEVQYGGGESHESLWKRLLGVVSDDK